jgi:hypothetical protein
MHIFTSITSNYIPKARVLAHSVKEYVPGAVFHLLLCDTPPAAFDLEQEEFDHLMLLDELDIDNEKSWIFQHNVVELCTAVKGRGFQEIFRRYGPDKIIFFDPDMVLFSGIEAIERQLDQHSVLLTPHQTEPARTRSSILDNEVSSLKYGVFNLGFLAVRNSAEGMRFVNWWSDRLRDFCFDDSGRGFFTDQKWGDLAPAFFPDLGILRGPQFNVSTWNIDSRDITGDLTGGVYVNKIPLCFYHFSGIDSGAQKLMLEVYGNNNPVLHQLRDWYLSQCSEMGQGQLGKLPCRYAFYDNGDEVRPAERLLYRYREALSDRFPNPYACPPTEMGYQAWFQSNAGLVEGGCSDDDVVSVLRQELDAIHHSITWRVFRRVSTAYRRLGMKLGVERFLSWLSR